MTASVPTADLRRAYRAGSLSAEDLGATWLESFDRWYGEAVASALLPEPNAVVLATATPDGRPSVRTVLLKGYDPRGFVIYTNLLSRKASEALSTGYAALCFSWVPLERQVQVTGAVEQVSAEESDAYFATRPRGSQLGTWASPQSQVVGTRQQLEAAQAEAAERFADAQVPRPEHWGGLRVAPDAVELWQGREDRVHDRLRHRRTDQGWVVERLAP